MKNVIFVNDSFIGTFEDIWKMYKEELKRQMDDNTLSFEELNYNFKEILYLMEQLEENENVYSNTLLKISETPMGSLTYKILEEED